MMTDGGFCLTETINKGTIEMLCLGDYFGELLFGQVRTNQHSLFLPLALKRQYSKRTFHLPELPLNFIKTFILRACLSLMYVLPVHPFLLGLHTVLRLILSIFPSQ